ncbi:hypothetical protein D8674_027545 [Pyrus ussuriensis x Pyrus communis]|uniref:DUF7788 domain-containing protein n=1 Tax=Pyrus ussuriensis x Pyrus communis TaxID=2448454 RepID=A0A5N5IEM1_9ROSA|nr:hypothetical protein D8674_027545 [Pyrus ussuriensis x Pyrus communis]
MLFENIARKVFRQNHAAEKGLEPANRRGYRAAFKREQVVAADEIDPDDAVLLPNDILSYIKYLELEQEADVNWKKMVEVYSKQGKLKNWLATLIKSQDWTADFGKVFDVILEEAVNANLKPDKKVKKALALTTYKHFLTGSNFSFWGETNYEEIRNKHKEKGYGDVVPHLVIWNMIKPEYSAGHCREPEPGVTLLSGFSYKLLESFFENDGDISPNHVMEAAVSAPAYQTLAVVD